MFQQKLYSPLPMYELATVALFFEVREGVLECLYSSPKVTEWVRSYARKGKIRFPDPLDITAPPTGEKGRMSTGPFRSQAAPIPGRWECGRPMGTGASLKKSVQGALFCSNWN